MFIDCLKFWWFINVDIVCDNVYMLCVIGCLNLNVLVDIVDKWIGL